MKLFVAFLIATFFLPVTLRADDLGEEPVIQFHAFEKSKRTERMAARFAEDIRQGKMPKLVDKAIEAVIRLAAHKLRRDGMREEANYLNTEFDLYWNGYLERDARKMTDYPPLSTWLDEKYKWLEQKLSFEVVHALRIDDLVTFNSGIPVVFVCRGNVSEQEYWLHFVKDEKFRGLGPTTLFWVSQITCCGATMSTGFFFCGPISMGAEFAALKVFCPKLNKPLWTRVCGGRE